MPSACQTHGQSTAACFCRCTNQNGGLQIVVYPMKREVYEQQRSHVTVTDAFMCRSQEIQEMGLAPGGLMRQTIHEDEYGYDVWDQDNGYRCFVHIANSEQYQQITGSMPPHLPPTAAAYTSAGLPWFERYSDAPALAGSPQLQKLQGIGAKTVQLGKGVLADDESVNPKNVTIVRDGNVVRTVEF